MRLRSSRHDRQEEHNEDDEGFLREEKMDVKLIYPVKKLHQVTIELPEGKELINFGRPNDLKPRCLAQDEITELPPNVSYQKNQKQETKLQASIKVQTHPYKSSCVNLTTNGETTIGNSVTSTNMKRSYNGRGKTLYDFFQTDDSFQLVFHKGMQIRPRQQIIYDYTAKTKVLEFTNDYDPKLYRRLKSHKELQPNSAVGLQFDSSFQCGNLSKVFQERASPNNFYCLLENDSNTHGYSQWFCFRVRNRAAGQYTFHIVNQIKNTSMYKQGMRVSIFSDAQNKVSQRGWYKGGEDISYSNTRIDRTTKENQSYYCLAFTHIFEDQQDTVYFALNQPYTYTRLLKFIEQVEPVFKSNQISFTKKTIGYSHANNNILSLVIEQQTSQPKKVIVIMARQHPGETMGSFIAEGLVETLLQESPEACFLIKHYRFVVIPMVNPDGVIYGHSRCNLAGLDLNRQWGPELMKQLTPETYAIKKYIQNLHEDYGVEVMIDLHGHSKKMNSFFYACRKQNKCAMRLLSFAMSKLNENFDASSCTYGLSKDKINTVRNQLFNIGISAYTLENSYFGRERNGIKEHYTQTDLKTIGSSLIKSLFVMYADRDVVRAHSMNRQSLLEQIETNIDRIQAQQNKNKYDSGSESDPDGDLLALEERVKTMRLRDPTKKSKLIKSLGGTLNKKRYMSSVYRNKLAKQEAEEQQKQKQKKKKPRQDKKGPKQQLLTQPINPQPDKKQQLFTQPAMPQPQKRRKSYTRATAILTKRIQRPSRTQTEVFNLSVNKDQILVKQKAPTKEVLSKNSVPSRNLFEHPSRPKGLMIKGSVKVSKTEPSASIEKLEKQISFKKIDTQSKRQADKFITELDTIRIRLTNEQLLKSYDVMNKEKCLDQTEFIKIESLYRGKKQAYSPPQQPVLSRKISRSKKKFKVSPLDPIPVPKFRKFESFLSETETHAQTATKHRAFSGFGDQNSVFYHFPLL